MTSESRGSRRPRRSPPIRADWWGLRELEKTRLTQRERESTVVLQTTDQLVRSTGRRESKKEPRIKSRDRSRTLTGHDVVTTSVKTLV